MNPEDNRGGAIRLHRPGDCRQQSGGPGSCCPRAGRKVQRGRSVCHHCPQRHVTPSGAASSPTGWPASAAAPWGRTPGAELGGRLSCRDALHPRAGHFSKSFPFFGPQSHCRGSLQLSHPGVFPSTNSHPCRHTAVHARGCPQLLSTTRALTEPQGGFRDPDPSRGLIMAFG